MSATLYDKALLAKIKNWTGKTKIQVFGPQETRNIIEMLADLNSDKPITLPMIILSRSDGYRINNTNTTPQTYNGKRVVLDKDTGALQLYNAIPITLNYTLDVYSRYEEEADAYMRELVFNFINYPAVMVTIPYLDSGKVHLSNVRISSDLVSRNSGLISIHSDQVFAYRLELDIDDAYLWDVREKGAVEISVDDLVVSYENLDNTVTKELVFNTSLQ